jgi:hypothetical protein
MPLEIYSCRGCTDPEEFVFSKLSTHKQTDKALSRAEVATARSDVLKSH